jgi:uncharacterized membrane protein (UPF0127 family)
LATKTKLIVNLTRGECICVGTIADRPLPRMRGLMGRHGLPAGEGLLLSPASAIHTAFMRFPIDALFLDRDLRVLRVVERLRPWRGASKLRARAVLELSAGECARRGVKVGDTLVLRDRRPDRKPIARRSDREPIAPEPVERDREPAGGKPTATDRACAAEVAVLGARSAIGPAEPTETPESIIWPTQREDGGEVTRLQPIRVLVVSSDRHFRSVTSMLLAHRGCSVTTTATAGRVAELIARGRADVVVIDAGHSTETAQTVAAVGGLAQPIGIVVVDEAPSVERWSPVLAKWAPFEELFAAIERAEASRGSWGATA